MEFKAYSEVIDYMFRQLPMYQRVGAQAFKKDLKNIQKLDEAMGHPHRFFPSIHIAGTNGKGSTAFMLAAMLQAHGFKTGLYVSPHYKDFRERIRINGEYISRQAVIGLVNTYQALLAEIQPSFFEISVAMAFKYFADQKVDIAIIETGLGGRLDSTNIIDPLVSVITNISLDHTAMLGNTIPEIAREKAGIIKSHRPVLIGEKQNQTTDIFIAKAKKENAPLHFAEDILRIQEDSQKQHFKIKSNSGFLPSSILFPSRASYQIKNLRTALAAFHLLCTTNFPISAHPSLIKKGLEHIHELTGFIGRWQTLQKEPLTIVDSAHNPAGLKAIFNKIKEVDYQQLRIVIGMVNDKDVDTALELFPKEATYYFSKANIPRGLDAKKLQAIAQAKGLQGKVYDSVKKAYEAAHRQADKKDMILVTGSVFVVAEAL